MADSLCFFKLECLTPVHIGSGTTLARDFDFVIRDGKTVLLEAEQVIMQLPALSGTNAAEMGKDLAAKIGRLLDRAGARSSELIRQEIAGEIKADSIREAIRDGAGRPLVPGSSLKGALRTLLLAGWCGTDGPHSARQAKAGQALNTALERARGRDDKFAAQPLEKAVFRDHFARTGADAKPGPHTDVLRTLSVADTPFAHDCLEVVSSVALNTKSRTLTAVEALRQGAASAVAINWGDSYVTAKLLSRALPPLETLAEWSRRHALHLLDGDIKFLEAAGSKADALDRESQSLQDRLQSLRARIDRSARETIFVRLGWGAGWRTMTGDILSAQEKERLAKLGVFKETNAGAPKTRKAALDGHASEGRPANVFGWISLTAITPGQAAALLARAVPEPRAHAPAQPLAELPRPLELPPSAQVDPFELKLNALKPEHWGQRRQLVQEAAQTQDDTLRKKRLARLAARLTEVFGNDRKRMRELSLDPSLKPYLTRQGKQRGLNDAS
jgi:CRISPR-associated protein Csm5